MNLSLTFSMSACFINITFMTSSNTMFNCTAKRKYSSDNEWLHSEIKFNTCIQYGDECLIFLNKIQLIFSVYYIFFYFIFSGLQFHFIFSVISFHILFHFISYFVSSHFISWFISFYFILCYILIVTLSCLLRDIIRDIT